MTTNVVNLDALIPREDFAVDVGASNSTQLDKIPIRELEAGFLLPGLRKPDFQRETARWSPNKIVDLVRTFLDGDLIPAVILWQSGKFVFVIDGAHRLSALMAWIQNDYGDKATSVKFFDGHIPDDQRRIAERTRNMIRDQVGSYADYVQAAKDPTGTDERTQRRLNRLATNYLVAQWVPVGDAKAASDSFFKINQAATPIDPTERRILKSRASASALAARAIVRGGTGHKYWRNFAKLARETIEETSKEIYWAIYEPPLAEGPVKTLDVPVAGRGYNALPFVFDLVNQANDVRIADSSRKKDTEELLEPDEDGAETVSYLKNVKRKIERITTTHPGSLGIHPIVYFYTRGGMFQPSAFLAASLLIDHLIKSHKLVEFSRIRRDFEAYLVAHKEIISQVVHKFGSGGRNVGKLVALYLKIIDALLSGKNDARIVAQLAADLEFKFLAPAPDPEEDFDDPPIPGGKPKPRAKAAAFQRQALSGAVKCSICGGYVHKNSMQLDHDRRKRDGGLPIADNLSVSHPYCNSSVKN
jgi:hypothetical protein